MNIRLSERITIYSAAKSATEANVISKWKNRSTEWELHTHPYPTYNIQDVSAELSLSHEISTNTSNKLVLLESKTAWRLLSKPFYLVAGEGFEPPTFGLWARRAARLLHPAAEGRILQSGLALRKYFYSRFVITVESKRAAGNIILQPVRFPGSGYA